ncbi:TraG/TraD family protein, partial [Streptococcus suis]|nr:TraG/TraD family protein [Streptococcus suis]
MGNYHARCGAGEKPEVVTPEAYLSLFGEIPDFAEQTSTV